ncbi:hypothetical protein TRAPUB_11683, partial [Trametes pubescens]
MFDGIPKEADLQRFFAYARRVKILGEYWAWCMPLTAPLCRAHSDVYIVLSALLQGRPLLPNVKHICYTRMASVPSDVFRAFDILLGPTLRSLIIESFRGEDQDYKSPALAQRDINFGPLSCEETTFKRMLAQLAERAPHLESLKLNIPPNRAATPCTMSAGFYNLVSLRLCEGCLPLGPDAFAHLGTLPRLQKLYMSTRSSSWEHEGPAAPAHSLFPALTRLDATVGGTLSLPAKLLACVSSPHLKMLSLEVENDVPRWEIDSLFAVLTAMPARDCLASLYITVRNVFHTSNMDTVYIAPGRRTRAPDPIGEATLAPLTALRGVEVMNLDIHCPFDVDDALLERLGAAWPTITHLILGTRTPWSIWPGYDIR